MNESNQRGTPPLKLSFFPFFLSLLLSRKKKEEERRPRARRRRRCARVEAQTLLLLFVVQCYNSRRPIFFCVVVQRKLPNQFLPTTTKPPFFTVELFGDKKKGGDFYGHGQKCSLSLCVVIKSSLRPPLAFFSPFFSSAHQEQQHSSCVVSDTFWTGSARRRPLFLSLSLSWGSLSLSLARKRREERTRARSESNTASRRVSRAGRCIRARARARGKTVTRVLCSRESKRESFVGFPWHSSSGKRKEGRFL